MKKKCSCQFGVTQKNSCLLFQAEEGRNIPDQFMLLFTPCNTLSDFWISTAWRNLASLFLCWTTSFGDCGEPYEHECEYLSAEDYAHLYRGHVLNEQDSAL